MFQYNVIQFTNDMYDMAHPTIIIQKWEHMDMIYELKNRAVTKDIIIIICNTPYLRTAQSQERSSFLERFTNTND